MVEPIWISEAEVVSLLDLGAAIDALERGLQKEAAGQAFNMVKTHVAWGHNNLHAIGAVFPVDKLAATKTWAHTEGGATPLLILLDATNGALLAVIEAFALGQMRTGGISGVATRWLADPQAKEMAIVGTGKQALMQVAAVAAVRPLERVRVFSPKAESRQRFIARLREDFEFDIVEASLVEAAVEGAPIVTVVTRATTPFLTANMLARGVHVNAVGAITPERSELAQDVFGRTSVIAVDSVPAAQKLSSELIAHFSQPGTSWDSVQPLSEIIASGQRRGAVDDLSLFKAMGVGLSDLSLAAMIHETARAQGKGRAFAHPQRAKPRIGATSTVAA